MSKLALVLLLMMLHMQKKSSADRCSEPSVWTPGMTDLRVQRFSETFRDGARGIGQPT